jgi:hypothetical protein
VTQPHGICVALASKMKLVEAFISGGEHVGA